MNDSMQNGILGMTIILGMILIITTLVVINGSIPKNNVTSNKEFIIDNSKYICKKTATIQSVKE